MSRVANNWSIVVCPYMVILITIVIYDDDITDAFFSCLTHLYSEVFSKQPIVHIALEKR